MSAGLTQRKDGFVEMAYIGDVGWHNSGNLWTPEEANNPESAIAKAGMDWKILRSKVRYAVERGDESPLLTMDDQQVLFRSDNKYALGIVGAKYKIVQPRETLMFFADLVGANGFQLETAGTLFGGKRFWAMASIGEGATIMGRDDLVNGYLLLTTSADGSLATTAKFTTIRVVCNNTLGMALSSKHASDIKISHRTEFDAAAVKDQLGIVRGAFGNFVQASRKLAVTTINKEEAKNMTAALLVDSKAVTKADVTESSGFKNIMQLFEQGKGNHGETAWDWVNGVTEYVDHVQRAKSDSHRMANSLFGRGDALKTLALERALLASEQ